MMAPRAGAESRPFVAVLLAICAGALALRLVYALGFAPDLEGLDDDTFYHLTALELADGNGYVGSFDVFTSGEKEPIADHPPLYTLLLSFLGRLGARSVDAQRMVGVLAGTLTVAAVGLVARRLAGSRAGLAAAALCAVYPAFIAADGALMSETLFGTLVAFSLLLALILLERPGPSGMAVLGLLVGLAALTRSEGLLLLPLLAAPVVAAAPARRVRLAAIMTVVAALAVTPWVVRNLDVFGEPVYSTNDGATLAGANCEQTYYGDAIGGFDFDCVRATPQPRTDNRAVRSRRLRQAGVDYASDHPGRAVVVAGARLARLWGFYAPGDQVHLTGRHQTVQRIGIAVYYAVLFGGAWGVALLVRRGQLRALAVLSVPIVLASVTAMATYGLVRLRHVAEVSLLVLAGVAISRLTARRARSAPPAGAPVRARALG
jgi:4-amino-4-deoxy-L-arabinose transferase-like glycosyltransferase